MRNGDPDLTGYSLEHSLTTGAWIESLCDQLNPGVQPGGATCCFLKADSGRRHPASKTSARSRFKKRRGAHGKAAARNVRTISFDVERCIDFAGAPKGGRACC